MNRALSLPWAACFALCAGCAQSPPVVDWAGAGFKTLKATRDERACMLVKASECAYDIDKSLAADGSLGSNFCGTTAAFGALGGIVGEGGSDESRDAAFLGLFGDDVVLAFRGTQPPGSADAQAVVSDWVNDANVEQVDDLELGPVHAGFLGALNDLWQPIFGELGAWKKSGRLKSGANFYVTGHSKGGAIAALAALRLRHEGLAAAAVYLFAPARAGGAQFASNYAAERIPTRRYENQGDVVPHLPPDDAELAALRSIDNPILNGLLGGGDYASVGTLVYVTDELTLIEPGSAEAQLDAVRLKAFREEASHVLPSQLLGALRDNHSIEPPAAGLPGSGHRYYRAVCGG